jgi:carbamoyl-phosphate synthase large subunit
MRILTEASGSLTASYLIQAIQSAGYQAVGSDIDADNAGYCLADDFIVVPPKTDPDLWNIIEEELVTKKIDAVIPSLDETMLEWAVRRDYFRRKGIHVIISPEETVRICQDKWETYLFFQQAKIPCPLTSLKKDYPLVKPRLGRGSEGISITDSDVSMDGMISQQVIEGEEYTIDTFFDKDGVPVYIIPRKRVAVKNGKSTRGVVCRHDRIVHYIQMMAEATRFTGPINFQCFDHHGDISFIEINPRIAGGMALGFAASENWIPLVVNNLIHGQSINPKSIKYGLKMVRSYAEYFIS